MLIRVAFATRTVLDMDLTRRATQTPRQAIEAECTRRGRTAVVSGCIDLLTGGIADAELIYTLGGSPASWVFTGDPSGPDYWLRVWAARGLLWVWDDTALASIVSALSDEAWRVREMAAKVVRRHLLGDALTAVAVCLDDPNRRVRLAAERAVVYLTEHRA